MANNERHRNKMTVDKETRTFTAPLEVRKGDGSEPDSPFVEVSGLVIRYDATYQVNDMFGSFNETIHRGAADDCLAKPDLDVRFLFNHSGMPYARTNSTDCPVVCESTDEGVTVIATLDTRMAGAADLYRAIDNGLISQMSVGMQVDPKNDVWRNEDDWGMPQDRDIYRLENIFDTSAVTYPASPTTTISARSTVAYEAARAVRSGRATQEQGELAMRVLETFMANRAAPTEQDSVIADAIGDAKKAVADAVTAQTKDADNNTDPADVKVMDALKQAEQALIAAAAAQAQDGAPDEEAEAEPEETDDSSTASSSSTAKPEQKSEGQLARERETRSREEKRRQIAMRIIKSSWK